MGAFDFFLPPVFDTLPEAVAERLLFGVIARKQAAETGLAALKAAGRDASPSSLLAGLGRELTLLAFDLDPLNAALAGALLAMAGPQASGLSGDTAAALHLAQTADWSEEWREALNVAERAGTWDDFLARFDADWPRAGTALRSRVEGMAALAVCTSPVSGVANRLERWLADLGQPETPGLAFLAAEATIRLHGPAAGMAALRQFLSRWPWCINAVLRLYDLQTGLDTRLTELPGELAIFFYTFNKAADLALTLDDLQESRLGRFRVFVLDNGSTDATPEVVASFRDRFGPNRFFATRAPVNVGAPAGRNWLKALPEAHGADFVAYLDDDLVLPADWALRLGAAVAAYPEAGVYGCRVVDAGQPAVLQATEFHLAPGGPGDPVAATDLQLQAPDLGQWSFCRKTTSVTGCCHLFSATALADGGDFDIRFSPSQFDDFDRDLRAALAGRPAVYQGHLAVGHKRRSGDDTRRERIAGANAHGNMLKLQSKYDTSDVRRLRRAEREWLLTDVRKKVIRLARHDGDSQGGQA
jgi:hypothetical protein